MIKVGSTSLSNHIRHRIRERASESSSSQKLGVVRFSEIQYTIVYASRSLHSYLAKDCWIRPATVPQSFSSVDGKIATAGFAMRALKGAFAVCVINALQFPSFEKPVIRFTSTLQVVRTYKVGDTKTYLTQFYSSQFFYKRQNHFCCKSLLLQRSMQVPPMIGDGKWNALAS